jgi:single-stranded-DNA-specific exonuclease
MAKRWYVQPHDQALVAALERYACVSSVVAQLLVARGVTDGGLVRDFLDANLSGLRDPTLLPGVPRAVELLHEAIGNREKITVYGDYDADGMTATAILYRCLQLLSANVNYYIPNRMDEGYGLNPEAIRKLADCGTKSIVSVDCGIGSLPEAELAKSLGVTLIITDHHELADSLPCASAIVHPRLPGGTYPFAGLCGAGVAFKLAWALCQRACNSTRVTSSLKEFLVSAVGLAAIGTVADVVPLLDENRIVVKHGLRSLKASTSAGIRSLLQVTGLDTKAELSSEDIGFVLGPRLNAAGRLGQAQLGVELLTTESPSRAQSLAEYINELNQSRASLERSIHLAAQKQIKERFDPESDPALVLANRGWHKGVIGVVAGRLAEKFHRPVVMISLDDVGTGIATGSARGIPGINLYEILNSCREYLVSHGGHAAAAGLKIDERCIDRFRTHFCDCVAEQWTPELRIAEMWIDTEAPLSSMTIKAVREIEQLAPFGHSNPRPLFCATGVSLANAPRPIGEGDRHVSLRLNQNGITLRAVAFNQPEWLSELGGSWGRPLDIAYRPSINEFRGQRSVELQLIDWRTSESTVSSVKS